MFSKLKYGLAIILSFIGVKMVISPLYHIESLTSLMIVVGLLVVSLIWSVLTAEKEEN
jgi:tellurite resistance protein TerC